MAFVERINAQDVEVRDLRGAGGVRARTDAGTDAGGLAAARARGRKGGRKFALTKAQVRLAQAAMRKKETKVSELCAELRVTRVTLYRYVGPKGELRDHGRRVLQS